MSQKQMRTPSGSAGLVRYDEEEGSTIINLKPLHVLGIAVALIIFELAIYISFPL